MNHTNLLRPITEHHGSDTDDLIPLYADNSSLTAGCAPARYVFDASEAPGGGPAGEIVFQSQHPANGINGITCEVMLAVMLDRLRLLQAGPYPHPANHMAIFYMENALKELKSRSEEMRERNAMLDRGAGVS